jgi:hypothetical protein
VSWHIRGEYFENCNCEILCPCLTSSMQEPGDGENGRCQVPMICYITDGAFNDVSLDGVKFVLVIDSPAIMSEGNWRTGLYIDEAASKEQRHAIQEILSGEYGGVPAMLNGLIGERAGVKYVPISFEIDGLKRRSEIPGIMEFEIKALTSGDSEQPMTMTNIHHPMGDWLPVAKSLKGEYSDTDFGFMFSNTGKNGHYREFEWQGA